MTYITKPATRFCSLSATVLALTVAVLLATASPASAGILLEPLVEYDAYLIDITLGAAAGPANGGKIAVDETGMRYGARVGYSMPLLFAAVDYRTGKLTSKTKEIPAGVTFGGSDSTVTSTGVTVGLDLPMLRPYAGYDFSLSSKDDSTELMGTALRLGLGIGLFPMVKINAEYVMATFTKSKSSSGETDFTDAGLFKSAKASGFSIGVSLPLSF